MKRILSFVLMVFLMSAGVLWSEGKCINYTDGNSYVSDFCFEGDSLWAATRGGVVHWNTVTGDYKKYTTADGLFSNFVYEVEIDSHGVKWFATSDGVVSFDGTNWTPYKFANGLNLYPIWDIAVDAQDTKWIVNGYSVIRIQGATCQIDTLKRGSEPLLSMWIEIDEKGIVWIGASDFTIYELYFYDGASWKKVDGFPQKANREFSIDSQGIKWFIMQERNGICSYDAKVFKEYYPDESFTIPTSIAVDNNEVKWILDYGLLRSFDGVTWKRYIYPKDVGLYGCKIVFDQNGKKWIGTDRGLSSFDGTKWTFYRTNDVVPKGTLLKDFKNNIWCGPYRFNGNDWDTVFPQESPQSAIYNPGDMVIDTKENIWFSNSVIFSYYEKEWKSFTDILSSAYIHDSAADPQGNVWFGTSNGVLCYDGYSWKWYRDAEGFQGNQAFGVAIDFKGRKWFGTGIGLSCFDGESWKTYPFDVYNGPDFVPSLAIDTQDIVYYGNHKGTYSFNGVTSTQLLPRKFNAVAIDSLGVKWFGMDDGLYRYDGKTWKIYTTADGLVDNSIDGIVVDSDNSLWVQTDYAMSHFFPDVSAVISDQKKIPTHFPVSQNYPNPFNPSTTISFILPQPGIVRISVYNIQGQRVTTILDKNLSDGSHTVVWDGRDMSGKAVASGTYFYQLVTPHNVDRKKMLLIR